MAGPWFSGARAPADWRRRLFGASLILLGAAGVGTAAWVYYDAWTTQQTWQNSPQAATLARLADEPTPVWVDTPPTDEPIAIQPIVLALPTATPALEPITPEASLTPTPVATATADQLSVDAIDFRFLDPPEPGAHARVAITLTNHADVSSGRILMGINASWFDAYSIIGTGPAVSEDTTDDSGLRTFSFPPIAPQSTARYELHVTSTEEGTSAPSVSVLVAGGDQVGSTEKPKTFAPTPRPGPVMSLDIPRLKLHSGVVQIPWEPPPFAVGQIEGTANVTQGNTVLIGHLTGAAGNVFAHLDQLEPGDEITATSRGIAYKFVVSQTFEGENTDAAPMQAEDDPRLTLMTCAGIWNPFTHDYSKRLWVIAEPPDQAAVTIANAQATATVVAQATGTAVVEATATAEAMPTETPVPTPYAGEPSLAGGIGNTRVNLEKAFGQATGETSGRLVVFHAPPREVRVLFTPDPPRASLITELFAKPLSVQAAVQEARKLFPLDASPRGSAPEGNSQFMVERFASDTLADVLGDENFIVIYNRDDKGMIGSLVLGRGDDIDAIRAAARR